MLRISRNRNFTAQCIIHNHLHAMCTVYDSKGQRSSSSGTLYIVYHPLDQHHHSLLKVSRPQIHRNTPNQSLILVISSPSQLKLILNCFSAPWRLESNIHASFIRNQKSKVRQGYWIFQLLAVSQYSNSKRSIQSYNHILSSTLYCFQNHTAAFFVRYFCIILYVGVRNISPTIDDECKKANGFKFHFNVRCLQCMRTLCPLSRVSLEVPP